MVIATTFAFSSFFTPTHGALARDKSTPQSITSAPLSGGYFRCTFQNRADGDLAITLDMDGILPRHTELNNVAPGTISTTGADPGIAVTHEFCTVSWTGLSTDVRATFCAYDQNPPTAGLGCVELW